jgi:hypothetical protein
MPVPQLAIFASRLMALGHQLHLKGARRSDLDLLQAIRITQLHGGGDGLCLPLEGVLIDAVRGVLLAPEPGAGLAGWPLSGFYLEGDTLVLRLPPLGITEKIWRDDLPVLLAGDPDLVIQPASDILDEDDRTLADTSVKQLVLRNLEAENTLLGLISNPKINQIPGLVAAVVTRCRSVRVLQVIASDRKLYTGHANKDVPRALLLSPCNVPVRTLRKFIHVKYVAKVDLLGLLKNNTSLRDDVAREIQSYLQFLGR